MGRPYSIGTSVTTVGSISRAASSASLKAGKCTALPWVVLGGTAARPATSPGRSTPRRRRLPAGNVSRRMARWSAPLAPSIIRMWVWGGALALTLALAGGSLASSPPDAKKSATSRAAMPAIFLPRDAGRPPLLSHSATTGDLPTLWQTSSL